MNTTVPFNVMHSESRRALASAVVLMAWEEQGVLRTSLSTRLSCFHCPVLCPLRTVFVPVAVKKLLRCLNSRSLWGTLLDVLYFHYCNCNYDFLPE